jgi:hypothetical protein
MIPLSISQDPDWEEGKPGETSGGKFGNKYEKP